MYVDCEHGNHSDCDGCECCDIGHYATEEAID